MKRKYTPRKPKAPRRPTGREYAVASYLAQGDKPPAACRKAGYAESVVRSKAPKIARSEVVQAALAEIGRRIPQGQLGEISKARLAHHLATLPNGTKHAKVVLGYIRTGAEVDGLIGGVDLHLHQHQHGHLSPLAAKMVAEMVLKLQGEKENQSAITVEALPAETPQTREQPKPVDSPAKEAPKPVELPDPIEEELLNRWSHDFSRKQVPFWQKNKAKQAV